MLVFIFNLPLKMPFPKLRLLLADDDKDDCFFFKEALGEIPIFTELAIVHDGEELISYLNDLDHLIPHILFLDLNMPRKNGFESLIEIKRIERIKQLHVIIFSTSIDQKMADLLYKSGAQYYIHKPPAFSQLKRLIHLALTVIQKDLFTESATSSSIHHQDKRDLPVAGIIETFRDIVQPARELFVLSAQ